MKKNLLSLILMIGLIFASCEKEDMPVLETVSFDNLLSQPNTEWTGDKSGKETAVEFGTTWFNQFSDSKGLLVFDNYFSESEFGTWWGGFAYTNKSDKTTEGANNNSAITGVAKTGKVYLTAYNSLQNPAVISFKDGQAHPIMGMWITNSTYAYLTMKNGNRFSKKFEDGDWFKLDIYGKNSSGEDTQKISVYLADYRGGKKEMLDQWTWVDLSVLNDVVSLHFELSSSDTGDAGMNTPSYFCIDDITLLVEE